MIRFLTSPGWRLRPGGVVWRCRLGHEHATPGQARRCDYDNPKHPAPISASEIAGMRKREPVGGICGEFPLHCDIPYDAIAASDATLEWDTGRVERRYVRRAA